MSILTSVQDPSKAESWVPYFVILIHVFVCSDLLTSSRIRFFVKVIYFKALRLLVRVFNKLVIPFGAALYLCTISRHSNTMSVYKLNCSKLDSSFSQFAQSFITMRSLWEMSWQVSGTKRIVHSHIDCLKFETGLLYLSSSSGFPVCCRTISSTRIRVEHSYLQFGGSL